MFNVFNFAIQIDRKDSEKRNSKINCIIFYASYCHNAGEQFAMSCNYVPV